MASLLAFCHRDEACKCWHYDVFVNVCVLSLRCSAAGDSFPQRQHAGGWQGGGRGHAGGMQGYGGQQQQAGVIQGAYRGNAGAMQGYGGQQQSQRPPGMLDHLSGIDFNQTLVSSWLSILSLPQVSDLACKYIYVPACPPHCSLCCFPSPCPLSPSCKPPSLLPHACSSLPPPSPPPSPP